MTFKAANGMHTQMETIKLSTMRTTMAKQLFECQSVVIATQLTSTVCHR